MAQSETVKDQEKKHRWLNKEIRNQKPEAIALGLIRELNADSDCLYSYTRRQLQLLTEAVTEQLKTHPITAEVIEHIVQSGDEFNFPGIAEVLDDIFECIDENGRPLPIIPASFHFDSFPQEPVQ